MIRVLVVDDSRVVCRLVTKLLSENPEIRVVGTASNGLEALERVEALHPDVITLDIEMPVMDGLTALTELRRRGFDKPVIMLSAATAHGAEATLEALALGATDFVAKPSSAARVSDAMRAIGPKLVATIQGVHDARRVAPEARPKATAPCRSSWPAPEIVVIASSTGGPNALAELLPALPGSLPVPVVIVQHMPSFFVQRLARSLDDKCALEVREAMDGGTLKPGEVCFAPGDHHLEICRGATGATVVLHQGPPENSCRPAADPLFRSVASLYGRRALAVVLTGMGHDGFVGARAIHDAGGEVVVQDRDSSVVWGMPGFIAEADLADAVLPLGEIAPFIARRVSVGAAKKGEGRAR